MNAGARYGLFLSFTLVPVTIFFKENLFLMAVVWALICAQLAIAAWLVWRRMGLRFAAAGMAAASLNAATFALLYTIGFDPFQLSARLLVLVLALLVAPMLFWVESRRNPATWRAWGQFMEDMTVRDMLRFRHYPDWRHENERSHR